MRMQQREKERENAEEERERKRRNAFGSQHHFLTHCVYSDELEERRKSCFFFPLVIRLIKGLSPSLSTFLTSLSICERVLITQLVCVSPTQNTCVKSRRIRPQCIYVCSNTLGVPLALCLYLTLCIPFSQTGKNWRSNRNLATEGNRYFILSVPSLWLWKRLCLKFSWLDKSHADRRFNSHT